MPSVYPGPYPGNERNDYVNFTSLPITMEAVAAGSIGVVTVSHSNAWMIDGKYFECFNAVALSQVVPTMSTTIANNGLNIASVTAANGKAIEITQGTTKSIKNSFLTRTSPAFFVRATFNIAVLNTVQDVCVGFRVFGAGNTTFTSQSDYAYLGVHSTSGLMSAQTNLASGGVITTATNPSVTAVLAQNFTIQVNVDGSGNVTYLTGLNNGALTATTLSGAVTYQFGASVQVIPSIICSMAAGANGEVDLVSYACGLL